MAGPAGSEQLYGLQLGWGERDSHMLPTCVQNCTRV